MFFLITIPCPIIGHGSCLRLSIGPGLGPKLVPVLGPGLIIFLVPVAVKISGPVTQYKLVGDDRDRVQNCKVGLLHHLVGDYLGVTYLHDHLHNLVLRGVLSQNSEDVTNVTAGDLCHALQHATINL